MSHVKVKFDCPDKSFEDNYPKLYESRSCPDTVKLIIYSETVAVRYESSKMAGKPYTSVYVMDVPDKNALSGSCWCRATGTISLTF